MLFKQINALKHLYELMPASVLGKECFSRSEFDTADFTAEKHLY
ncbi:MULTISPECIES: hypothetical protein [Fischerella]|nr:MULTISPECIES: hypothetical protein [Fischerella]